MATEILIHCPDGQSRTVQLKGDQMSLGRAHTADLCFAEDAGLSRQHLMFERDGEAWTIQDLGSKNGTLVNRAPLRGKQRLNTGDRIEAGHLVIIFNAGATGSRPQDVVFFEGAETESPSTATFVTSLEGALSHHATVADPNARRTSPVQALIKAGQELAGNRPLGELFPLILELAIEAVGAQRGVVLTLENEHLIVQAHKGEGFRISSAVRNRVLQERTSVLVRDTAMDSAWRERHSIVEQKVRTLMAVPLQTQDHIIGLIYVDSPFFFREFTADDLSLLTVMANVAAIRIEHTRLAEAEERERVMKRDLEQAAEIQQRLLPAGAPNIAGADLAGYNAPCRTVGGDYYDFLSYPNGRVALLLGDVSGKGMPAALLMMGLQARVQVLADEPKDLSAVMTRLNRTVNCPTNRFITLFICIFDPATGELTYCNAGHNPPMLVRAGGKVEMLEGGGPVLGILPTTIYAEYRASLHTGDMLVLYSDGVSEATNANYDEFGEERLAQVLIAHRSKRAEQVVEAVSRAITEWAAGAPMADDLTLVVARRA